MSTRNYTQHEDALQAKIDQYIMDQAARGRMITKVQAFDEIANLDPDAVQLYYDEARARARLP